MRCSLVLALLLAGCTTSRALTPWMRISATTRFDRQGYLVDDGHAYLKVRGRWVERRDGEPASGFGFDGGRRAVLGSVVWDEHGPLRGLDCDPKKIFATPDDGELLCVEVSQPRWAPQQADYAPFMLPVEAPDMVRVTRYDRDGRRLERRALPLPVQVGKREPFGPENAAGFLGFRDGGLVFSIEHIDWRHQSFAAEAPIDCDGWLLRSDGSWRRLGTLHTFAGSLWECNFPSPWNARLGMRIAYGRRAQDANGIPRW